MQQLMNMRTTEGELSIRNVSEVYSGCEIPITEL